MIVAICGASANLARCARVRDSLRRLGIEIAFDWVAQIERDRAAGRTDDDLSPEERHAAGDACLDGIDRAHVVLWLADGSEGAGIEVGYAFARRKSVIVSGPRTHPIYGAPCGRRVDAWTLRDSAAIDLIVGIARGRGRQVAA